MSALAIPAAELLGRYAYRGRRRSAGSVVRWLELRRDSSLAPFEYLLAGIVVAGVVAYGSVVAALP